MLCLIDGMSHAHVRGEHGLVDRRGNRVAASTVGVGVAQFRLRGLRQTAEPLHVRRQKQVAVLAAVSVEARAQLPYLTVHSTGSARARGGGGGGGGGGWASA